ncbi:hypothetical protein EXIGLDRAFT_692316 [Exidia glandulosa HHB12029]|uniref:Amidohydrolase-related domain-containing protein n=1 Tax=Exidia glandulosa HHB12029 TaxID=1314781 RepID=A0A165P254_EXIGL|nr:hypothetical protein EXIGLDRAFT_692316 [Exidia glandulosa HHB12029]
MTLQLLLRFVALACVALHTQACLHGAPVTRSEGPPTRRLAVRQQPQMNAVIVKNVRVFEPLAGVLSLPRDVAFENGRFVSVADFDSSAPTIIDGTGRTLLPGLIESHSHPETPEHLQAFAQNGVTTVMSLACSTYAACTALTNLGPGFPDVHYAGNGVDIPGNQHEQLPGPHPLNETITEPEQAAGWVQAQVDKGASFIKMTAERASVSPTLSDAALTAVVQAATSHRLLSNCHAADFNASRQALDAGVNIVHHSPTDVAYDDVLLAKFHTPPTFNPLALRSRVSVPTLTIMRVMAATMPNQSFVPAQDSVKALHEAGIPILVGTDANPILGPTFGPSMHEELANLVEVGFTPAEALQSATLLPARHWMLRDRGVVAPGMRADLFLVNGDPTKDISVTTNIEHVWIEGVQVL